MPYPVAAARGKIILQGEYIDYRFDEGSLSSYTITDPAVPTIRITPKRYWSNVWAWYAIRSWQMGNKTPHFLIAKAGRWAAPAANEAQGFWSTSPDTDSWYQFDNQIIGADDIELYNNSAFPGGVVYISFLPMYPFSRTVRKIGEWAAQDGRIVSTPSATNFILGNATPRDNGDGRIATALPFYAFMLTNASGYTKNNLILATHNHPSENQGPFQLEGAIDWLLGGSEQAEFLLDWHKIYVYPCVNPQGVWGGYHRSCPEDTTKDHNRYWDVDTLECIHAFRDAMLADTGGVIDVGLDYHAALGSSDGYMSCEDHTLSFYANWLAKMQAYDAGFGYLDETLLTTLSKLWRDSYSAKLGAVPEYGALKTKTITDWKIQGKYTLQAAAMMTAEGQFTNGPIVGSRDFNGVTDRIDWTSPGFNPKGVPITVSAWVYLDRKTTNQYVVCINQPSSTTYGIVFNLPNTGYIGMSKNKSVASRSWVGAGADVPTGAWIHCLWTNNGGDLATDTKIYLRGVEKTVGISVEGSGDLLENSGEVCIGGRKSDDLRNLDGKLAQVGVWNRELTSIERDNLFAGYAPDLAAPDGLQFYFRGNIASLTAFPGGLGVTDGTTYVTGVGNGPGVIYRGDSPCVIGSASYRADVGSGATIDNLHDNAMTVEGWFRIPFLAATQNLCVKGTFNVSGWHLRALSNGKVSFWVMCDDTPAGGASASVYADNLWHHFAATWNDAGDRKTRIWVDGILAMTSADAGIGAISSDASENGVIGGLAGTVGLTGAHGWVRWSNLVRYAAPFTPPPRGTPPDVDANTVGQWNVREGSGATIADSSGNANHGSLAGTYSWSTE